MRNIRWRFSAISGFRIFLAVISLAILFSGCQRNSVEENLQEKVLTLVNKGKGLYDSGKFSESIEHFKTAADIFPSDVNLLLNYINALIAADQLKLAEPLILKALELDKESGAAHYLNGIIHKRNREFENALKSFQTSELLEPNNSDLAGLNNLTYQIGMAHFTLEQWDEAIEYLTKLSTWDEEHPAVWYNLGQALIRADRNDEAEIAIEMHQQQVAIKGTAQTPERDLEICRHTEIKVPFVIELPAAEGIDIKFKDVTSLYFDGLTNSYSGPIALIDFNHTGTNSIWTIENNSKFRLLMNSGQSLRPADSSFPLRENDSIHQILVGDLQNSGFEDVLALGKSGFYAFNMMTNGLFREQSTFAGLNGIKGQKALLSDFNFTGHLDLIIQQDSQSATNVMTLENIGNYYFFDISQTSSIPYDLKGISDLVFEDWNQDDMLDLILAKNSEPTEIYLRQRGEGFNISTNTSSLPLANAVTTGDINNDLIPELISCYKNRITIVSQSSTNQVQLKSSSGLLDNALLKDIDNDGWKDVIGYGTSIEIWRNLGPLNFTNVTSQYFGELKPNSPVRELFFADMDNDGDSDMVIDSPNQNLQILSNEGGNQNRLFKLRLDGTRSNRSGLGMQIELTSGNWRTLHTVHSLPIEIGTGAKETIDILKVRWSDAADGEIGVEVSPDQTWQVTELRIATGSCPYLYAWDGERFNFITDLLGAAPLGLPARRGFMIPGDPVEIVKIGTEDSFRPKEENFVLQVTEELREVLYLDEAKLIVVDHPEQVEVFSTSKLASGPPPQHKIIGVKKAVEFVSATRSDGLDVLKAISRQDNTMVSPVKLRKPQYRGLAEPWYVEISFDKIAPHITPILVLHGWLQFGGGMANISGSLRDDFPFPFPNLEAWSPEDGWMKIDLDLGAPSGKTKTIIASLKNKLPEATQKLRIHTAFEIHWDRVEIMDEIPYEELHVHQYYPNSAHLHWRGFSKMHRNSIDQPHIGIYEEVSQKPNWTHTPEGWCTRYGDVTPLVTIKDDKLALLNGGDELTLSFYSKAIPSKEKDQKRSFFFYNVGWDKDADFHVTEGKKVGPLPWHGMDYQRYGTEAYPTSKPREWINKWNTRWVPNFTFERTRKTR